MGKQEHDKLQALIENVDAQVLDYPGLLRNIANDLATVTKQRDKAMQKCNHLDNEVFGLRSEVKTLLVERDLARQRVNELLKHGLELQRDLTGARLSYGKCATRATRLTEDKEALESQLALARGSYEHAREAREVLIGEVNALIDQRESKQSQVETLHRKIEADRAEAARATQKEAEHCDPWILRKQLDRAKAGRDQGRQARDIYLSRWEQANEQFAHVNQERNEARHIACRLLWDRNRLNEHLDDVMERWGRSIERRTCRPINKTVRVLDLGIPGDENAHKD